MTASRASRRRRKPRRPVVILGATGVGIDLIDIMDEMNLADSRLELDCVGFLEDDPERAKREIGGRKVIGRLEDAGKVKGAWFVNAIANPTNFWTRDDIVARTGMPLERFQTLVHPRAAVSRRARLGLGTIVYQNATISANVVLGNHVLISPNAVIGHDTVIGDQTCVTNGVCISAGVKVGHCCFFGANCTTIGFITIGDYALVGIGAVVREAIPADAVYVGNPARYLRPTRPTGPRGTSAPG